MREKDDWFFGAPGSKRQQRCFRLHGLRGFRLTEAMAQWDAWLLASNAPSTDPHQHEQIIRQCDCQEGV